jgi:hypothetical protein
MIDARPEDRSRFDRTTHEELRRRLLRRGARLASLLAEVLAGNDRSSTLAALGLERPGKRPDEILRDALNQVDWRRRLLVGGDDRYGRCDVCGAEIALVALLEMPWADRCEAHASRWS